MAFFKTTIDLCGLENALFLKQAFYVLPWLAYKESLMVMINHNKMHFVIFYMLR